MVSFLFGYMEISSVILIVSLTIFKIVLDLYYNTRLPVFLFWTF